MDKNTVIRVGACTCLAENERGKTKRCFEQGAKYWKILRK